MELGSRPEICAGAIYLLGLFVASTVLLVENYSIYRVCGDFSVWVYALAYNVALVSGATLTHMFSYNAIQRAWMLTTPLTVWGVIVVSGRVTCVGDNVLFLVALLQVATMAILSLMSLSFCCVVPRE